MVFKLECRLLFLLIVAQTVMGMTIVDDSDSLMMFSNVGPSWSGETNGNGITRGYDPDGVTHAYQLSWHEALGDGAWVSLTFTGTHVSFFGTICTIGYPTVVDFYIDGQHMSRYQNNPEDTTENLCWYHHKVLYKMADFDDLSPGEHTLKAVSVGAQTLFVVDYIAYEPSAAIPSSSSSIYPVSISPSMGTPRTTGSTDIGSTVGTIRATGTISTSLSTSSSSLSGSQSTQPTTSIATGDSQPLAAAMDVPASDSRILYSPVEAWLAYSSARRATSCLEGTRSSSTAGLYLAYNFTGTTIQVYTVSGLIGGNYSISIDGQNQGTFTSYAASEDPSNCSSRPAYSTTGLSDTQHALVLTTLDHSAGSTQYAIQFVGFRVSSSTPGSPSSSNSAASGPNIGAIAGGVVGVFAGLLLIILLKMWWMRRRQQGKEAMLEEALDIPASSSVRDDSFTSSPQSDFHIQGRGYLDIESKTLPGPPTMVQHTPSTIIVPNPRSDIYDDTSTEISTYYTLPPYHGNVMERPAASNLSEADVEAISKRLRQVMQNRAAMDGGSLNELIPPRELIDHLVQERMQSRAK